MHKKEEEKGEKSPENAVNWYFSKDINVVRFLLANAKEFHVPKIEEVCGPKDIAYLPIEQDRLEFN